MTVDERDALLKLEYNLKNLTELVQTQSLLLKKQQQALCQLQAHNQALEQDLQEERQRSRMRSVAQGLQVANPKMQAQSLSYIAEIIKEVEVAIKLLEKE